MELDMMSRQAASNSDQEALQAGPPQPPAHDVASMPGFRFHPTEEELVGFYLRSMVMGNRLEVELINVLNLYLYDPWELPAMAFVQGEREWLFFCPRDKKYPNGARPNRVTASGYWKATGTDRPVRRANDARCIGLKKTLVFYRGKAPRGRKTEWIMNEYRLPQNEQNPFRLSPVHNSHLKSGTSASDDRREVALCRIYKKPFQINVISTGTLFADNVMKDVDPSGCSPQINAASASPPTHVKLAGYSGGLFPDTGMGTVGSTSTARRNSVNLETHILSSNLMHCKYPALPAAGNLSAQLMAAEAHDFCDAPAGLSFGEKFCALDQAMFRRDAGTEPSTPVVDRLNWSDCLANTVPPPAGESGSGIQPGNPCPTIASIDWLLKASTWSPLPPLSLDYASVKLDCGDDIELAGSLPLGSS